jgi:hypothetical protein
MACTPSIGLSIAQFLKITFLERDGKSSHILPYLDIEFLEVGMILEIFYFIF